MNNVETAVQEGEHSPLELFGGDSAVLKRMTKEVYRGIKKKCREIQRNCTTKHSRSEVLERLAKKLYGPYETFEDVLNGNVEVNYTLFDRLEHSLNLSIDKVLDRPRLPFFGEARKYWLKEPERHPIGPGIPGMDYFSSLSLYFECRAISRLRELSSKTKNQSIAAWLFFYK